MYKIGERFELFEIYKEFGEFILAQVVEAKVCLVDVKRGNRWSNPVPVVDVHNIIEEEINEMIQMPELGFIQKRKVALEEQ